MNNQNSLLLRNSTAEVSRLLKGSIAAARLFRPAELDHTRLKVTERTFNKTSLLLVVGKEVKPKRMLNITKKKKSVPSLKKQYR